MKIKVLEQDADIPIRYARYMIAHGLAVRDTGEITPQIIETTVEEVVLETTSATDVPKPTVKKKAVRKKAVQKASK